MLQEKNRIGGSEEDSFKTSDTIEILNGIVLEVTKKEMLTAVRMNQERVFLLTQPGKQNKKGLEKLKRMEP